MALTAGTILGQYEIRSPLGAGGMGEVYRAHDTRLDRDVAIKVLPEYLTSDPERLHRFEQEARATAALNHPNILAVYQMATDNGLSYLVEELLEGETLRECLQRGPIPLRKAIDYAVQVARGLAAAHDRGIVHRDLKPENLFVTQDGRVKILDFGLARLVPRQNASGNEDTVTQGTDPGVVLGTASYMSPEQVRGQMVDHRTDIFSFGTILYEVVTGNQPFRKPTPAETMTSILNDEPPSILQVSPNTPPGLQRIAHRCLEKDPKQRFHSAHDLAFALEALSDSAAPSPKSTDTVQRPASSGRRITLIACALAIALIAVLMAYIRLRPEPAPRVSHYVQLTHDGHTKQLVGSDGLRLYFNEDISESDAPSIAAVSVTGGESSKIPARSTNMVATDISPDSSELLVAELTTPGSSGPLWSLPLLAGTPRRLGDLKGSDAAWSRDGKMLAYCDGGDVFVAKADGTDPHNVATVQSSNGLSTPTWSPDGAHVRFDSNLAFGTPPFIWEVGSDGANLHRLLSRWHENAGECCGRWTADGKYFVFQSQSQLWALPRKSAWQRPSENPILLTSSPLSFSSPLPGRDGKKLFVVGRTTRGELMRYDLKSRQFSPFLGGISADYADVSRDGQWVTYVSFPEGTLWRSKIDGSDRLQLTHPPMYALTPRWSPDGREIVFVTQPPNHPARINLISAEGGAPRQLLPDDPGSQWDPNWSPDGSKIVFGGEMNDSTATIQLLDVTTHEVSTLPGSKGLFAPRWGPDRRYILAESYDVRKVVVFDFQTQKWRELAKGEFHFINLSKDGKYVYYDGDGGKGILRIRISDGHTEQVLDLRRFRATGTWAMWISVAPDGSLLLLRDAGASDIYSLDWEQL
jgi:serine/threonine protein kinase/Tol biopolymer transport system component